MLLLLDNYDSFTYNVYQLLAELGALVRDQIDLVTVWIAILVAAVRRNNSQRAGVLLTEEAKNTNMT